MRTDREQAVRRLVWAGTQRVQPVWWGSHRGFQGNLGDTRGGKTAGSGEEGEDPETREGAVLFPIPTPALE